MSEVKVKEATDAEIRAYQLRKTNIDPVTGKTSAELRKLNREAQEAQDTLILERSKRFIVEKTEVEPQNIDNDETRLDEGLKPLPNPVDSLLFKTRDTLDKEADALARVKNIELPKFANKQEVAFFIEKNS